MSFQIDKEYIIRLRRELHQVPEVGFDLPKTLAIVRRELDAIGIPYTEKLGKSAIVATLNEGVGNKTIGLRADMDALPVEEQSGLEFASTIPGQMHACGHDCHTAVLLETAKVLKAMKKDIKCCVKFVFQACEEGLGGAKSLCDDGLMDSIDFMICCHVAPHFDAGTIHMNKGATLSCSRGLRIDLTGKACHASRPQEGVDALAMAVRIYNAVQLIKTREISPFEPVIINIGQIVGGTANNIVAESAYMNLSLRTLSNDVDEYLVRRITEISEGTATEMGGKAEVTTYKYCPCLVNDAALVDAVIAASEKVVAKDKINPNKPVAMGAEDFAYYTLHKPGLMFNLGVKEYDGTFGALHNGKMTVNEDVLDIPAKIFVEFVLDQMEG